MKNALENKLDMAATVGGGAPGGQSIYCVARDDQIGQSGGMQATITVTPAQYGQCDVPRIRREHAFLIPQGASPPFRPRGPVLHLK